MNARPFAFAGKPRAVLLDFGGTLDTDGEHWHDAFQALYSRLRPATPPEDVERAFYAADHLLYGSPEVAGLGLRPLMDLHAGVQLRALGLSDPALRAALVEGFCAPREVVLLRNAGVLARLRGRGYLLGVVSNFYGNVEALCDEAGLSPSLGVIVDSARVGVSKPDPRIFALALGGLGVEPREAVFVGDSLGRDMEPARALGMTPLWLRGGGARRPEPAGAAFPAILRLTELEALLP